MTPSGRVIGTGPIGDKWSREPLIARPYRAIGATVALTHGSEGVRTHPRPRSALDGIAGTLKEGAGLTPAHFLRHIRGDEAIPTEGQGIGLIIILSVLHHAQTQLF